MPGAIIEPDPAAVPNGDAAAASDPFNDDAPVRPYTVFRQQVWLDIDVRSKAVKGRVDIFISVLQDDSLPEVFIDARQCDIDLDHITVSGCPAEASYEDPYAAMDTPEGYCWTAAQWGMRKHRMRRLLHRRRKELSATEHESKMSCTPVDGSLCVAMPSRKDLQASLAKQRNLPPEQKQKLDPADKHVQEDDGKLLRKISIPFTLRNIRDGLHFVGVDDADPRYPHLYTLHSNEPGAASYIFPCIDDPGCRSSWKVSLTFPRTLGDAFRNPPVNQTNGLANGNRKRKHGEEEPRRRVSALTEEDKLLELTAICSGKLEDETLNPEDETKKTMTFECGSKAARHIGFAIGPFEHVDLWSEFRTEEDDNRLASNATKIHGYCLPGRAEEVKNTCAALVTAIDHFAMTFGRYPFENYKACFVDDMVNDSVPLCGFSLSSNRLLFPREIIDTEIDVTRSLVHSLACQWFGVNIIPDTKADIWLVVGIAWFMTDLFMKVICGNNEYRFRMKTMADRLVELDMNRPSLQSLGEHLHLGDFEVDFLNLKAPLVLFILDRRLSKSSSSAPIVRLIAKMVSKANTSGMAEDEILASEPFRKACEKSGQTRLDSFWNQWITGSGCPRFDVYQKFNKKRLCVEMTVRQVQDIAAAKSRPLNKDAFWREVVEEKHDVWANEVQHSFSGPMTIRIHEADGTPYEHIVEIREDSAKSVKFEIPYNTKYKRLKRSRRQRDRQIAANTNKATTEENQDDALLYCLGDVLQAQEDVEDWGFIDWDEEQENKMDQESYEWIRMDADFEWICTLKTNMPAYMYVSQLQQDRDVVAQQDSMLYLDQESRRGGHPLISTILTRTLVDVRYFHGIRTMAADILPCHAVEEKLDRIGLKHLMKTFQQLFCYEGTYDPRPNDFTDKRQYLIQCAIPGAVARVRDSDGHCPKEGRRFILQLLQGNDNEENCYSDQFYVCKLIEALAACQVPDEKKVKQAMPMSLSFGDGEDEDDDDVVVDPEPKEFRRLALEEIDRYRRMDEYSPSYQNCFTVAALDALCRLMKAKVIPVDPLVFVQYLQDKTIDTVRIKGFESLVELGYMSHGVLLRFFLSVITTDPSPFVRDRLFRVFCRGLASMAIGENEEPEKDAPAANGLDLIVDETGVENKQKEKKRRENLTDALAALKERTRDNDELMDVVTDALDSPIMSVAERRNLLELCGILFDDDERLLVKLKYPTYWTARRGEKARGKLMMHFKRHYRLKSRKVFSRPEPKRTITLNVNRPPSISLPPKALAAVAATPPPQVGKPAPVAKPTSTAKPTFKPAVMPATPRPAATAPTNSPATPREPKGFREPKESKDFKDFKDFKEPREPKELKEPKEFKEPREPKDFKAPREPKELKEYRESKEPKEAKGPRETKEFRRDNIAVQASRPSIESGAGGPERKALPSFGTPATKVQISLPSAKSSTPLPTAKVPSKPSTSSQPSKPWAKPSVATSSSKVQPSIQSPKPPTNALSSKFQIGSPKPSINALPSKVQSRPQSPRPMMGASSAKPGSVSVYPPKHSSSSGHPSKLQSSSKPKLGSSSSSSSLPSKTDGAGASGSLAPPAARPPKRPSTEPAERAKPSKIVKLSTKGIPRHIFQTKSKLITLKFNAWDKLKFKPTPARTATPDGNSIRANAKHHAPDKRSHSLATQKPSKSQSPHRSTPTSSTNNSFSSPPLAPSSAPTSQARSNLSGTGNSGGSSSSSSSKVIRKPLPGSSSGDRRPLPSAGGPGPPRTSLPSSGGSHPSQSATAGPPPPASSAPPGSRESTPAKTKLKIKLKTSSQQ